MAAEVPGAVVDWQQGDLFDLPFAERRTTTCSSASCSSTWRNRWRRCVDCARLLRPGGTITLIEGDHGSAFYHPASEAAQATIDCLVRLQADHGGNGLIGRQVEPLLTRGRLRRGRGAAAHVYVDETRPELVEGFTLNTFTEMVSLVREDALAAGLISETTWDRGIADLRRTAEPGGTFHYTFFKGVARQVRASTNR